MGDLHINKELMRKNLLATKTERASMLKDTPQNTSEPVADRLQIRMKSLDYRYGDTPILQSVTATCAQGELLAIVGPHGVGKTTLLRLLSQEFTPTGGELFVPAHLRVVFVSQRPMFMKAGVYDNATFGLSRRDHGEYVRVQKIMQMLGMPSTLALMAKQSDSGEVDGAWSDSLPFSEQAKLHLLRAFVMNPEVLICQRPLSNFTRVDGHDLLRRHFRAFVENRGLALPASKHRRPRTLIFSADDAEAALEASTVWRFDPQEFGGSKLTVLDKDHPDVEDHVHATWRASVGGTGSSMPKDVF